jgi:hypothetical protein
MSEVLAPLSRARRERFERERRELEAETLAPMVAAQLVQPLENLLAERFTQNVVPPVAGRVGYQDLLRPDAPAAGSDFTLTVTGDKALWPLSVVCRLTTDANPANRTLTLEYRDSDGTAYLIAGPNLTIAASQQQRFAWHPEAGVGFWPVGADTAISPLPQQIIYAPNALVLHIGSVQAGDQLDLIRLSVFMYPTGPQEVA